MEEDSVKITVVIPEGMKEWLDSHKEINRSKLMRDSIQQKMHLKKQKVHPLVFLISIMGIVFSITLIGIASIPTPMEYYWRAIISLLGGVLAFATAITYYRERKRINV